MIAAAPFVIHEDPWKICYQRFTGPDSLPHVCDLEKGHETRHFCQAHSVREKR